MSATDSNITENIKMLREKEKHEPIAGFLGLKLVEFSEGYAKVTLKMRPEYINFNGMVFGGIVMAAADQAFAYATNSMLSPNLAVQFNIHLIAAAAVGDELTAECRVAKSGRRISVSEMTVTNQEGRLVAKATGTTLFTG
ncbi:MAG: PaaI family thioesterase [Dehalococcoidales bacterium]|nr:PaaI family thioesterase [Dehalococcoidales bacterium]